MDPRSPASKSRFSKLETLLIAVATFALSILVFGIVTTRNHAIVHHQLPKGTSLSNLPLQDVHTENTTAHQASHAHQRSQENQTVNENKETTKKLNNNTASAAAELKQDKLKSGDNSKRVVDTSKQKAKKEPTGTTTRKELVFFGLGDWGGTTPMLPQVANQMDLYAQRHGLDFVVSLGDNFYPYGVKSLDDPAFNKTFEQTFTAASLQVRWYSVLGNHDHFGSTKAQIQYTGKGSGKWYMPNGYYTSTVSIPQSGKFLQLFALDTYDRKGYKAQLQWIDKQLEQSVKNSSILWRIVVNHNPIYSGGTVHGGSTGKPKWAGYTKQLIAELLPILHKHRVHMYLSADDHNLQLLKDDTGMIFIVSGCGGGKDKPGMFQAVKKIDQTLFKRQYQGGFSAHHASATMLRTVLVNHKGEEIFAYNLTHDTKP
eukprot:TRINITY_DN68159_c8_g1_i3.p1 TRINITY_DN68159_c8_g1~~TRINITY_DN68159_c8_g1_i3.p1  ORF type:complete len:428 (+),score=47.98 TRINITY_DN68159_c8_g1_i3:213-1496(+)